MRRVMSVATSDSGAGAGIQADLKAFLRCGVYGTTAVVATTAQNTVGVTDIYPFPPGVAVGQIEAVVEDIGADAVKTGMLFNSGIISAVAGSVDRLKLPNVVVDPVMVAESGAALLEPDALPCGPAGIRRRRAHRAGPPERRALGRDLHPWTRRHLQRGCPLPRGA